MIFDMFQCALGLACNLGKCQVTSILCDEAQVQATRDTFPCPIIEFSIKYLGIHLALGKLSMAALQPLVDRVADALLAWKGHLKHRSSHLTLVKITLSALPIYTAISVHLPPWLQKTLVRISKAFLWSGSVVV
jgi:hypothetical protein